MIFNLENYKKIIHSFKRSGYEFIFFNEKLNQEGQVILRHDIDFDVDKALEFAKFENKLGVNSTYFFLIRSDSYNFLEPKCLEKIKLIKDLGHQISLHFDPTQYEDFKDGLKNEIKHFEYFTDQKINVISFHRPPKYFLNLDKKIGNIAHTYQKKFFKDIKYISDSGGDFFYENPIECQEFKNFKSIQFLTHPIWWTTTGETNIQKIENFLEEKKSSYSGHIAKNCKPWNKHIGN